MFFLLLKIFFFDIASHTIDSTRDPAAKCSSVQQPTHFHFVPHAMTRFPVLPTLTLHFSAFFRLYSFFCQKFFSRFFYPSRLLNLTFFYYPINHHTAAIYKIQQTSYFWNIKHDLRTLRWNVALRIRNENHMVSQQIVTSLKKLHRFIKLRLQKVLHEKMLILTLIIVTRKHALFSDGFFWFKISLFCSLVNN